MLVSQRNALKATDMCCYNSMLSRVIMQQAYPQLGIDPVASNCVGLSIKQIQQLDFDKIDLTSGLMMQFR